MLLVRYFRSVRRLSLFLLVIAYYALVYALVPSNRRSIAGKAEWLSRTCRSSLKALGIRCVCHGTPSAGAVIAANHVSYMDILAISALHPVVFVAKKEVAGWPIFGWFACLSGTRFIDRSKKSDVARVADDIPSALVENASVVLFLEGTSSDGTKVLPFRASLLEPVARDGLVSVPAAVAYRVSPGHSAANEICWWGDMTLVPHLLNMLSIRSVEAHVSWGSPVPAEGDRKAMAVKLQAEVSRLHAELGRELSVSR